MEYGRETPLLSHQKKPEAVEQTFVVSIKPGMLSDYLRFMNIQLDLEKNSVKGNYYLHQAPTQIHSAKVS